LHKKSAVWGTFWAKPGHRKADGRAFFAIPGSNGRIYFTDMRDCSCPDRRQRDETCKHIRAVRLWVIQKQATAPTPSRGSATADADGLASDAEIAETMAAITGKHAMQSDEARADAEDAAIDRRRAERLATYRRELGMVEVA